MKNINVKKKSIIYIYIISALIVSLALFSTWSVDYGIFYSISHFVSVDQLLYKDFFTHKGPAYFYFINVLGNLFGWGGYSIVVPYFFTIIYFLLSNIFFISNLKIKESNKIFLYILFLGFFSFQNANASLVYFLCANIIFSITFFFKYLDKEKTINLFFSIIFISLAVLTRPDALCIAAALILSILILNKVNFLNILIFTITPTIIFFFFKNIYGFSFNDLYLNIFLFNSEYLKSHSEYPLLSMFHRPNHFLLVMASGFLISFLGIVTSLKLKNIYKSFFNVIKDKLNSKNVVFLISAFFLILTWLYSRLDQNHHVILLELSLYLLIVFLLLHFPNIKLSFKKYLFIIIFTSFMLTYLNSNIFFFKNISCVQNLSCKNLVEKQKTILDIKNYKKAIIIDSTGYEYILSNTAPIITINNWFLLWSSPSLSSLSSYQKALSRLKLNQEITLWIRTTILNEFKTKVKELFNKNIINVIDQGYYTKVIIKPI